MTKKVENGSAVNVGKVVHLIRPICSMRQLLHFVHQKCANDRIPCPKKCIAALTSPKTCSLERSSKRICCPPASAPELSVNYEIRSGYRKPGELRLNLKRVAICAKVSKHAIHFCISLATGISNVANLYMKTFH